MFIVCRDGVSRVCAAALKRSHHFESETSKCEPNKLSLYLLLQTLCFGFRVQKKRAS